MKGDLSVMAMGRGEKFFIAIGTLDSGEREVLGVSSHRIDENEHDTAVHARTETYQI